MVSLGKRNDLDGDANMGRETYLIPMEWEPTIVKWEQVSETKWEPVRYLFPVAAPMTGKVERFVPLPFLDKPQYIDNSYMDDFTSDKLNLKWNFIRVPQKKTISLIDNPGYLRLYPKSIAIENRKNFSMIGFRQKQSDFNYQVKMNFIPKEDRVESGIIHYQKEWNYLINVVYKIGKNFFLEQKLKEKDKKLTLLKKIPLKKYNGNIIFKTVSRKDSYSFHYSLDNGENFTYFTSLDAIKMLDRNYTGALLGMYASSNGEESKDYADFDWIRYKDYIR